MNVPVDSSAPSPPSPAPRDRSAALVGYGWILVASGAVSALLALVLIGASALTSVGGARIPVRPEAIAIYALVAATLSVLGVGSIRARRWARALIVVVLWLWLLTGVGGFLIMAFLLPAALSASAGGITGGALSCATLLVLSVFGIFLIALPLLLLLFYRRRDVLQTVERRSPASWTDSFPESLLGIVLALALGGVVSACSILSVKAVPFFGVVLTGSAAVLLLAAAAAVSGLLTFAVLKRSPAGWWGLVLLQVAGLASFLTMSRVDMKTLLGQMGYADEQIEMLGRFDLTGGVFRIVMGAMWIALWIFLFSVRKHFRPRPAPSPPSSGQASRSG